MKSMLLDFEDWVYIRKNGVRYLPPRSLRLRVHGSTDIEAFLTVGKNIVQDMNNALNRVYKKNVYSFQNILDFGCGCSRILRWFDQHPESCNLYGTDIDQEAIVWNRANIPFVQFEVNGWLPPLPYPSHTFDFIYVISVFTHINEDYQFQWLSELKRVAKPGAVLIASTHGRFAQEVSRLSPEAMAQIAEKGFLFMEVNNWKGVLPDFYQTAYHNKNYVLNEWSKYFRVVDYIERGINNHHDLVILEKTD